MLYFIDFKNDEFSEIDNSLKLLEKKAISSEMLSEVKTKTALRAEPLILIFSEVSENLITLLRNDSRIDLFFSWGDSSRFTDFALKADKRYLGTWDNKNPGVYNQIVGIYRYVKNQRLKDTFYESKITDLSEELKSVVSLLEKEVYFSRDRYKKVRKKFEKKYGNLNFSSIYKVGLNSGSEVNEIFEKNGRTYWVAFSTSTYSASADLIRTLEEFMGSDDSFEDFKNNILNLVEKNNLDASNLKTFLLEIEQGTLKANGYLWGDYYFLSTNKKNIHFPKLIPLEKGFVEQAKVSITLERSDKGLLISPGVLKNFNHVRDQDSLVKFCLSHIEQGKEDLLDELLIELKMKYDDDFFENDSFLTYMEVSPNAILAVN